MSTEPNVDPINSKVDILIAQVGKFTEGITEMRLTMTEGMDDLRTLVREGFGRLESSDGTAGKKY